MWCLTEMLVLSYHIHFSSDFIVADSQCLWALWTSSHYAVCHNLSLISMRYTKASKTTQHLAGLGQLDKMSIETAFQKTPVTLSAAIARYVLFVCIAESQPQTSFNVIPYRGEGVCTSPAHISIWGAAEDVRFLKKRWRRLQLGREGKAKIKRDRGKVLQR